MTKKWGGLGLGGVVRAVWVAAALLSIAAWGGLSHAQPDPPEQCTCDEANADPDGYGCTQTYFTFDNATIDNSCLELDGAFNLNVTGTANYTWRSTEIIAEAVVGGTRTTLECYEIPEASWCTGGATCTYSNIPVSTAGLSAGSYYIWVEINNDDSGTSAGICNGYCAQWGYAGTISIGLTADAGPDRHICQGDQVQLGGEPVASGGASPYGYSWEPTESLDSATASNPWASPDDDQTYTLTVTDSDNCTATDDVNVTVFNRPPAPERGSASICRGESFELPAEVSEGVSIQWFEDTCGEGEPLEGDPVVVKPSRTTTYYGLSAQAYVNDVNLTCYSEGCGEFVVEVKDCAPVPTLNEWGLIGFILTMAAAGIWFILHRRRTT